MGKDEVLGRVFSKCLRGMLVVRQEQSFVVFQGVDLADYAIAQLGDQIGQLRLALRPIRT